MTHEEKLKKIVANPILWIENFCQIANKLGKIVPFILNPQQKYLIKNFDDYNIVLKSRQLGITSVSCAMSLYYALTKPNTTCLLMSYSIDSATGIFEKLKQIYNNLPSFVKVKDIAYNKKELKFINGSRIIVATCGTKDVARGLTITYCHISECGFMGESVEKQLLAIEQAMTPNGKLVVESTANGINYFCEMWNKAVNKDSLYKPFFFSWIDDKIMFADAYRKAHDKYIEIHGSLPTHNELTEKEKGFVEKGATINQIVWRRFKIMNSSEEEFAQEFPSNPIEAFTTTGSNVFSPAIISERLDTLEHTKHRVKTDFNAMINGYDDFENENYEEEIESRSISEYLDVLLPYLNTGSLKIWKLPAYNEKYYIGVDCSEGLGGKSDSSTIEIIDSGGFQCAEFKSNKIKAYQFAELIYNIGMLYNYAFVVIEKASAGHSVLDKLYNDYGYFNLYKHKSYDQRGKKRSRIGFDTNQVSKPLMIRTFQELFETAKIWINSKDLLVEMKTFQLEDGKYSASSGYHDDLVIAFALALQGLRSGNYCL